MFNPRSITACTDRSHYSSVMMDMLRNPGMYSLSPTLSTHSHTHSYSQHGWLLTIGTFSPFRLRLQNWLMRIIEEIYDARFITEAMQVYKQQHPPHDNKTTHSTSTMVTVHTSVNNSSPSLYASSGTRAKEGSPPTKHPPAAAMYSNPSTAVSSDGMVGNEGKNSINTSSSSTPPWLSSFPAFVANRLVTTIGIRSLVDQTGNDPFLLPHLSLLPHLFLLPRTSTKDMISIPYFSPSLPHPLPLYHPHPQ